MNNYKKIEWLKKELAAAEKQFSECQNVRNQLKVDLYQEQTGIVPGAHVTCTFANGVVRHEFLVEEVYCDSAGDITLNLIYTFPATGKRTTTCDVSYYTLCERVGVKRDG